MKQILCFFVLAICVGGVLGCSPNERIFYKDDIACSASNRGSKEWEYYTVEIGTPNRPYGGKPELDFKIPGIGEFRSNSVTMDYLLNIKDIKIRETLPIESTPKVGSWPKTAKKLICGSFLSFVIEDEKIVQIKIMHSAKLKMHNEDKWHSLPCTENEIVEIFGKPDRIYEWFRE